MPSPARIDPCSAPVRAVPLLLVWMAATACEQGAGDGAADARAPDYVGRESCATCHQDETVAWQGSHHDLAMQEATDETVLADFDATSFTHQGVTTSFSRSADGFHVETEGADGQLARFDVAYTFGAHPLQQYLIETEGGRLQALSVVWDTRSPAEGGQRWFHLYPDETIPPGDVLHWTGPSQNWNYMCAECHSTGLRKGYDVAADTYATTWEEIDVSCEACHGPGSSHVAWAEARRDGAEAETRAAPTNAAGRYGLTVELGDPSEGSWVLNEVTGMASRTTAPPPGQIETCARCHSRRASLAPESPPEGSLFDTHAPEALERGLYHADGQILDEVYVWGSFRQTAMYQAGVRCSDCHEPHSGQLRAEGNGVCAQCHFAPRFDSPEHHRHDPGTPGSECVSCHMPFQTYMGVDDRRDHAFRVPRPDVSARVESPDACTACHTDRSSRWAADRVVEWYGSDRRAEPRYGDALHAGREGAPDSRRALASLVTDPATPAIVRATALGLLAERPDPVFGQVLPQALIDPDPQVRAVAVRSVDVVPLENRLSVAGPSLNDPTLAVRAQAARVLAPIPRAGLPPGQVRILDRAIAEYEQVLQATMDHPSAHLAMARLHADQGRAAEAEQALRTALRIGPWFVPAWANLADFHRSQGQEEQGEAVLREALALHPDQPSLHFALGLSLTRTDRPDDALQSLAQSARLGPDEPRYAYGYALALNDADRAAEAIDVLEQAAETHPNDPDVLFALATIHRDEGNAARALDYARRLLELSPDDPNLRGLVAGLESGGL